MKKKDKTKKDKTMVNGTSPVATIEADWAPIFFIPEYKRITGAMFAIVDKGNANLSILKSNWCKLK